MKRVLMRLIVMVAIMAALPLSALADGGCKKDKKQEVKKPRCDNKKEIRQNKCDRKKEVKQDRRDKKEKHDKRENCKRDERKHEKKVDRPFDGNKGIGDDLHRKNYNCSNNQADWYRQYREYLQHCLKFERDQRNCEHLKAWIKWCDDSEKHFKGSDRKGDNRPDFRPQPPKRQDGIDKKD